MLLAVDPVAAHRRRPRRAAAAPHVRAHAARRDPRLHLADRPPLDGARRRLGSRHARRGLGRRLRRRSARGSTTTSPPGARSRARSGRGSSRSGRAASGSGAGSSSARSPAPSSSAARARASRCSSTPPRPACCSPRAIGRIGNWWNQELYGKPTKLPVGRSRSTPDHRPLAVLRHTRPSTRPFSTS